MREQIRMAFVRALIKGRHGIGESLSISLTCERPFFMRRSFRVMKPGRNCSESDRTQIAKFRQLPPSGIPPHNPTALQLPTISSHHWDDAKNKFRFIQSHSRDPASSAPENIPEMKSVSAVTEDAANIVLGFIEKIGGVSAVLSNLVVEVSHHNSDNRD